MDLGLDSNSCCSEDILAFIDCVKIPYKSVVGMTIRTRT